MRFSPSTLLDFQGVIWLFIGVFLLSKGVWMLTLQLSVVALFCGWLKARFVLIRVVRKNARRLERMSAPIPLRKIFERRTYLIIACMMGLGVLLRKIGLRPDIHGMITTFVGSALLNGSFFTFRRARAMRRYLEKQI